jgi:hypothetical protein
MADWLTFYLRLMIDGLLARFGRRIVSAPVDMRAFICREDHR